MLATLVVVAAILLNDMLWHVSKNALINGPAEFLLGRAQGLGIVGLLPGAVLVVLAGRVIFGMTLRQQWGGTFTVDRRVLLIGLTAGVAFGLIGIVVGGLAVGLQAPDWGRIGWNIPADLWEEIIVRGLLLQVVLASFGRRVAIIWVLIVFGPILHGFGTSAIVPTVLGSFFTIAVLATRSLWAGYIAHLTGDALDTLVG